MQNAWGSHAQPCHVPQSVFSGFGVQRTWDFTPAPGPALSFSVNDKKNPHNFHGWLFLLSVWLSVARTKPPLHFMVEKPQRGSAPERLNSLSPSEATRERHPPTCHGTRCPETTQSQPKSLQFSYATARYAAKPLFYFNLCYKSTLYHVQRRYHPAEHVWMLNFYFPMATCAYLRQNPNHN